MSCFTGICMVVTTGRFEFNVGSIILKPSCFALNAAEVPAL